MSINLLVIEKKYTLMVILRARFKMDGLVQKIKTNPIPKKLLE